MRPPAIQWGQSIKMEKKGSRRRISIEFAGARTGALLFSDNFSPQFDPRSRKNSGTIFFPLTIIPHSTTYYDDG